MVIDQSGNLFGVTRYGGGNDIDRFDVGGGTVYEVSGTSLKTLHRFCSLANCADGEYPYGGLVEDELGRLYGSASSDEVQRAGTIFRLKP